MSELDTFDILGIGFIVAVVLIAAIGTMADWISFRRKCKRKERENEERRI